ncbi:hypothetical protein GIX45_10360 [Erwinia sp. CPCC 100877]|nr:hypothetical protein [Erwinia sp. CPCC 100877]
MEKEWQTKIEFDTLMADIKADAEFAHLKPLSKITSNKGLQVLSYTASPGCHCPMHTALSLSNRISGLSTLVLGTPECCSYSHVIIEKPYGKNGELHWTYVMDANETVFGCRAGVLEALKEMDAAGAQTILLIITCIPELIGEDLESLAFELEDEISARILPILVGHFRSFSYPSGFSKTLIALSEVVQTPEENEDKRINLIDFLPNLNQQAFVQLEKTGLELVHLAAGAQVEDFVTAANASLNIANCPIALPFAKKMKRDWAIPYIAPFQWYHSVEIQAGVQAISEQWQLTQPIYPSNELAELAALEDKIKKNIHNKCFIIDQSINDGLSLALYLTKLGLIPILICLEEFYEEYKIQRKQLTKLGVDPLLCHSTNPIVDAKRLAKIPNDFKITSSQSRLQSISEEKTINLLENHDALVRSTQLLQAILQLFESEER